MFLFILATLIIGSVHTLTIGYPVQTASSTHGDFPTQGSFVQGSIRCLDKNGEERVIRYIYPKPVDSQVYYTGASSTPYERTYEQQQQQHHHHHHHYQGNQPIQADRHYKNTAHVGYTPEVQRARQEHFKLFNEMKSNVEHKQQVLGQQIRQFQQQQHEQIQQFQQQQHRQIVRLQEQQHRQLTQDPMDVNRKDYFDNCEQW